MTGTEDLHEGEVTTSVSDLAILVAVIELQVLDGGSLESLLSWPLKSQRPSLVTEPVADEVSITSVDENWDLLENAWNKTVEWLHPLLGRLTNAYEETGRFSRIFTYIALEQEVAVDVARKLLVSGFFSWFSELTSCKSRIWKPQHRVRLEHQLCSSIRRSIPMQSSTICSLAYYVTANGFNIPSCWNPRTCFGCHKRFGRSFGMDQS